MLMMELSWRSVVVGGLPGRSVTVDEEDNKDGLCLLVILGPREVGDGLDFS